MRLTRKSLRDAWKEGRKSTEREKRGVDWIWKNRRRKFWSYRENLIREWLSIKVTIVGKICR